MVTISLHSLEKLTDLGGKQGNLYQVPGISRANIYAHLLELALVGSRLLK